jgi:hypothetical protein
MRELLVSQHGVFRICCVDGVGTRRLVHACSRASQGLWLCSRWYGLRHVVSGCWWVCVGKNFLLTVYFFIHCLSLALVTCINCSWFEVESCCRFWFLVVGRYALMQAGSFSAVCPVWW